MAVKKTKSEEFIEFIEQEDNEVQTSLPSVEADFVEETEAQDWYDYLRINLNELEDGDEYWGRPFLTDIQEVQFDEEEKPRHRCRLLIIDDDEQEYLQININLKDPKWSTKFNRIRKVNIEDWINYVNSLESMNVKVVTKDGSSFTYNSFRIIEANKKE